MFALRQINATNTENRVLATFDSDDERIHVVKHIVPNATCRYQVYPADVSQRQLAIDAGECACVFLRHKEYVAMVYYTTPGEALYPVFRVIPSANATAVDIYFVTGISVTECKDTITHHLDAPPLIDQCNAKH